MVSKMHKSDGINDVPVGSSILWNAAAAPAGFLIEDGSAISRTTYKRLFAAIGTLHGIGDGATTFNLPDSRGKMVRGVDGGAGNDPDAGSRTAINGGNSGDNVGSVQGHEFTSHAHAFKVRTAPTDGSPFIQGATGAGGSATGDFDDSGPGGNETRSINLYKNYIIKF